MAAAMHLNTHMSNMFTAGLLENQFQQLQVLKDSSSSEFVAKVIMLFCKESEQIIGNLAKLLDKPCVDFEKVDAFVHRLKGSSSRWKDLDDSTELVGLGICLKTLDAMRNDLCDLHIKFQIMLQLQQQVQAFYPKQ